MGYIPKYQFGPLAPLPLPGLSGVTSTTSGGVPELPSKIMPIESDPRCPNGGHWNETAQMCVPNFTSQATPSNYGSAAYNTINSEAQRGSTMFSLLGQATSGMANAPGFKPNVGLGAAGGAFSGFASGGLLGGIVGAGMGFLSSGQKRTEYENLKDLYERQQFANKKVSPNLGYYAQFGGETPGTTPAQTEKGEIVLFPDNTLPDVMATKYHKNMKDDKITDMLPDGSYIFSNDKTMKFDVKDVKEKILGYGMSYYDEQGNYKTEEMEMEDFLPKRGKMTFAEAAEVLRKTIKTTGKRNDIFDIATDSENLETRVPYIMQLIAMQDEKNQDAGRVGSGLGPEMGEMRYGSTWSYASKKKLNKQFGGKGQNNPIYTSNPNDPRLQAYQDSLTVHNIANEWVKYMMDERTTADAFEGFLKNKHNYRHREGKDNLYDRSSSYATDKNLEEAAKRLGKYNGRYYSPTEYTTRDWGGGLLNTLSAGFFGEGRMGTLPVYEKPIQPIIYKEAVAPPTRSKVKKTLKPILPHTTVQPAIVPPPPPPKTQIPQYMYHGQPLTQEQYEQLMAAYTNVRNINKGQVDRDKYEIIPAKQYGDTLNQGYTLPEFTVVSTNKPKGSAEYNTLEYLDKWQNLTDEHSTTNMWNEFGNPDIYFGTMPLNSRVPAWYGSDGIGMQGPDQTGRSIASEYGHSRQLAYEAASMMKAFNKLKRRDRKGDKGRMLMEEAAKRQRESGMLEDSFGDLPHNFQDNLIAELTHAKQHQDKGSLGMAWQGVKSWLRSPFFTRKQQLKQYDLPGSLENEAHSVIEPELLKRAATYEAPTVKIDLPAKQYGGPAERKVMLERKKIQDTFPEPAPNRDMMGPIGEPGARAFQAALDILGSQKIKPKSVPETPLNSYPEIAAFLKEEGYEGKDFMDKLKGFQKSHNLMVDGIPGSGTIGAIDFIADPGRYFDAIHGVESKGAGDYAALNDNTGAVGRYQFVPGALFHSSNFKSLKGKIKPDSKGRVRQEDIIKAYTGVESMEEFRNSKEAQDKYAKYYAENALLPDAIKAKRASKTKLPLSDMIALVHFQGYSTAVKLAKNPDSAVINAENNMTAEGYLKKYRQHLKKAQRDFSKRAQYGSTWTIK